jgi:hypothetical protein
MTTATYSQANWDLAGRITSDEKFAQELLDALVVIRSIQKGGEVYAYEIVDRQRQLANILTVEEEEVYESA